MSIAAFDVDIDFPPSFDPLEYFPHWTKCSMVRNEVLTPHPCGVHPQAMARDAVTGLAAVPYEQAEELGFFKLDMLHLNVYQHFSSREEILALLEIEPDWSLLLSPGAVAKLLQLGKHIDLLQKIRPSNVEELADVLALIRPGKMELLPLYLKEKPTARKILYSKGKDGYSFKKSHAHAYALVIILQLHLIDAGLL